MDLSENSALFVYADNEPKSVPARDLGGCRDNHEKPAIGLLFCGLPGGRRAGDARLRDLTDMEV